MDSPELNMVYSDEYKFIYLAISRTASGTIQDHLQKYGIRNRDRAPESHINAIQTRELLGEERWNNYFKFTFVRNPWDRAVSLYHWKKNFGSHGYIYFHQFNERTQHDILYHEYLLIDGKPVMNFIGKYETLKEDLNKICDIIGIPAPQMLTHSHKQTVSDRKHYRECYVNQAQIDRVRDLYHRTIDLIGYQY